VSGSSADAVAWARDHAACFEVERLVEAVRGQQVQVGFTVNLYARLPLDERPRSERWQEAAQIRARLHSLLQSLAPEEGGRGRLEIQPDRTAAVLAPEAGLQPEIAVVARVFHGDEYFAEVTEGEEKRVYEVVRRLTDMGLKERRGGTR
jgi:hypothetical protein